MKIKKEARKHGQVRSGQKQSVANVRWRNKTEPNLFKILPTTVVPKIRANDCSQEARIRGTLEIVDTNVSVRLCCIDLFIRFARR
jgi:hypothetical protein